MTVKNLDLVRSFPTFFLGHLPPFSNFFAAVKCHRKVTET